MLRRIDLTTLRKNPHAGETDGVIPVGVMITLEGDPRVCARVLGAEAYAELGMVRRKTEGNIRSRRCKVTAVWQARSMTVEKANELGKAGVAVTFHHQTIQMHSIWPCPEWIYEFEPLAVTCNECGAQFDYGELQSDSGSDADSYSDTVCPKCGEWNCVDNAIEIETVEQARARGKAA